MPWHGWKRANGAGCKEEAPKMGFKKAFERDTGFSPYGKLPGDGSTLTGSCLG